MPAEAIGFVERIQRSAERMDTLTKDLLRYSRVARERVELTPTRIEEVLDDVMIGLRSQFGKDGLIVYSPLHPVLAQPMLLQQCLANLVENAAKFVGPGVAPRVIIRTELNEACSPIHDLKSPLEAAQAAFHPVNSVPPGVKGDPNPGAIKSGRPPCVRIWVEDNGIGIAPEYQKKVFGLFERVAESSIYHGTGVGLAIVAKAAQRMRGSCGVESMPGKGSKFWIDLLAVPANSSAAGGPVVQHH
jgi:signal transduction histidine kinase